MMTLGPSDAAIFGGQNHMLRLPWRAIVVGLRHPDETLPTAALTTAGRLPADQVAKLSPLPLIAMAGVTPPVATSG